VVVAGGGAALRRQAEGPRLQDGLAEQFVVALAALLGGVEADLTHVDLELELEVALGGPPPDGPRRGGQGQQHAFKKFAVVVGRRQVHLRESRQLLEEPVEWLPGVLHQVDVRLRFRTCAHQDTSRSAKGCVFQPPQWTPVPADGVTDRLLLYKYIRGLSPNRQPCWPAPGAGAAQQTLHPSRRAVVKQEHDLRNPF